MSGASNRVSQIICGGHDLGHLTWDALISSLGSSLAQTSYHCDVFIL
jgi:hypothetical protein